MRRNAVGVGAVLAVALLLVIASTAGSTVASFGDSERINATFSTVADQPSVLAEDGGLTVTVQNDQQTERWADGISVGPPDYQTSVLVVTGGERELRLEITSDATEPLRFDVDAALLADALGVSDLRGVTATLDGDPLEFTTRGRGDAERVIFTIDRFSTPYVAFTAPAVVDEPPTAPPGNGTRPPQAGGPSRNGATPMDDGANR